MVARIINHNASVGRVIGLDNAGMQVLWRCLSFMRDGAERTFRYQHGLWDGMTRLFDWDGYFPVGLTDRVKRLLREDVVDDTQPPEIQPDLSRISFPLWPHQEEGLITLLKPENKGRGIAHMATGSGKTRLAIAIAQAMHPATDRPGEAGACVAGSVPPETVSGRSVRTLALVTTQDIRQQFVREANRLCGPNFATEVEERGDINLDYPMLVMTTSMACPADDKTPKRKPEESYEAWQRRIDRHQSHMARWEFIRSAILPQIDVLIADEAHHTASESYSEICLACTAASWRFGFTGTPIREDGADMLLEACTGPVRYTCSAMDLVNSQKLIIPTVYFVRTPLPFSGGQSYREIYEGGIVFNQGRNELIAQLVRRLESNNRHTLVLVKETEHGKALAELTGLPIVHGKLGKKQREKLIADMAAGTIKSLIGTTLADEGLDIPILDAVVLAGGGKSEIKAIQRTGRAMRIADNKTDALIFDFEDTHHRLLAKHSRERGRSYEEQGYPVYSWDLTPAVAQTA